MTDLTEHSEQATKTAKKSLYNKYKSFYTNNYETQLVCNFATKNPGSNLKNVQVIISINLARTYNFITFSTLKLILYKNVYYLARHSQLNVTCIFFSKLIYLSRDTDSFSRFFLFANTFLFLLLYFFKDKVFFTFFKNTS